MISDKIFALIANNGVWAVLFFMLLILQIKDSRAREEKYQKTIEKLNEALGCVKNIEDDMKEVRRTLCKKLKENEKLYAKVEKRG